MKIWALSDPHLTGGTNKDMSIFGGGQWKNWQARIEENVREVVEENDIILMPGDISWAQTFEAAIDDLKFLDSLPGYKIISKGNHDFWFSTVSQVSTRAKEQGLDTLFFVGHETLIISPKDKPRRCSEALLKTLARRDKDSEYLLLTSNVGYEPEGYHENTQDKIRYSKAVSRLGLALTNLRQAKHSAQKKLLAVKTLHMSHYPLALRKQEVTAARSIYNKNLPDYFIYGHLHGLGIKEKLEIANTYLVSADSLDFKPKYITELQASVQSAVVSQKNDFEKQLKMLRPDAV